MKKFTTKEIHSKQDVTLAQNEKGDWYCIARTGNWASDFFYSEGKNKEDVIREIIKNIKNDGEEIWLLNNPLLKIN